MAKTSKIQWGIGWKAFDENLKCREFQFRVGKIYRHDGPIKLCKSGFHFHRNPIHIYNYYDDREKTRICEILYDLNNVEYGDDKATTGCIKILRELSKDEILDRNTGDRNTGDRNTGDYNTGYRNTGDWNTGDCNTGDWNTGDCNTGYRNTGDCNTGDWNTGYRNTGYRNTGDCNTGNWNTGIFNQEKQKICIFDMPSDWFIENWYSSIPFRLLNKKFYLTEWKDDKLVSYTYHDAWRKFWDGVSESERAEFYKLPNFDAKKFEQITGIKTGV